MGDDIDSIMAEIEARQSTQYESKPVPRDVVLSREIRRLQSELALYRQPAPDLDAIDARCEISEAKVVELGPRRAFDQGYVYSVDLPALLREARRLRAENEGLARRVAELGAVVGRLPKTADGVPVTPGQDVFGKDGSRRALAAHVFAYGSGSDVGHIVSECYSTKAAAASAAKAKGN